MMMRTAQSYPAAVPLQVPTLGRLKRAARGQMSDITGFSLRLVLEEQNRHCA